MEYWGFLLSSDGRRPTPGKITQLANWPDYEELADLRSHVHFVEYLKEFIPNLPDEIAPLRPYLKKGARFDDFPKDARARAAKNRLTKLVIDQCVLTSPDFEAAANPEVSGRPFEIFSDASDFGWRAILGQRERDVVEHRNSLRR